MTRFAAGGLSALTSTTTFADKAAYDGFEKADLGELDGQVGGTGFSGAYSANASMKVVERSLVYENGSLKIDGGKQALQMKRSTEVNENLLGSRPLAETHAEDVFYVSALFYIDRSTKSNNNRDTYWVGLSPDGATRPAGGLGVEDTAYKWGGIIGGQSRLATVVEADKPHFIVAKIHKNTNGAANKYDRINIGATEVTGATARNNDQNGEVRFAAGLESPTVEIRSQGGVVNGSFIMDAGTADINKLYLGRTAYYAGGRNAYNTEPATGTYTQRGGTTVVNEAPRGMRIRNTANGIVGSFGGLVIVVQ